MIGPSFPTVLGAAQRGDEQAFVELWRDLQPAVLRYLRVAAPAAAEDLAADTFEKACRNWRRFDPRRGSAKTWLCQIARSAAIDHFRSERRRRRREETYALREPVAEDATFGEGLSPWLERALGRLSAAEREVIALRVVLEIDGESAARLLGISPTACSTRLHRAVRKLEEVASDVLA